jgi:hypothetical protein
MSNLVNFNGANLPSVSALSTVLRSLNADIGPTGTVIIKMDKTGHWVFGADQTVVEDDSTWAVNPYSFIHGFIAWGDGEVLGEAMTPLHEPLPEVDMAPHGAKKGWESQVGLSLKCLTGEDANMDARFTTTSKGGKRAVHDLAVAIATQVDKDQSKPVPVVRLKVDSYKHTKYGKVLVPVFEIVDWISMDGEPKAEAPVADEAPAAEAAPARRRRG